MTGQPNLTHDFPLSNTAPKSGAWELHILLRSKADGGQHAHAAVFQLSLPQPLHLGQGPLGTKVPRKMAGPTSGMHSSLKDGLKED